MQILAEYIASGGGAQEGESGEDGASAEDAAGEETTEESDEE